MYPKQNDLPTPISNMQDLDTLDAIVETGDINETPFNVFIGHNLGHRVFTMSVPFRKFKEISAVANNSDMGSANIAQRPLDDEHAKKLAIYMVKGLVSAAKLRRIANSKDVPPAFDAVMRQLGEQPYFSLQPLVCNIRGINPGASGPNSPRGLRLETRNGETAAFKVFLAERHILWVVDGQHRRHAADLTMSFLDQVRQTGKYPSKGAALVAKKGEQVAEDEMRVWNEAYDAARSYATLTVEVHLGLGIDQERQLFHDLNRLGKKVDASLAFKFDGSNPITHFIKSKLGDVGLQITETESKDWGDDNGALLLKDVVAVNAIAFLNKGNVAGATPAVIEPREEAVLDLWSRIVEIPGFGLERAKEKTVAAQPVVLKALAKVVFDLNFSNRRPENGAVLYKQFLDGLTEIDFSHNNPMWNYYGMTDGERLDVGLSTLKAYLPDDTGTANRDIGAKQGGFMRFGAKHNDIYPILGDMIRWSLKMPSRHNLS
jgi:hypothetical protein